jgi:hypothetical protein
VYDEHELDKQIQAFANHIGNHYFGELHGETPNTVLAGATVDYHKFKHQKQQAKTQRIPIDIFFAKNEQLENTYRDSEGLSAILLGRCSAKYFFILKVKKIFCATHFKKMAPTCTAKFQ